MVKSIAAPTAAQVHALQRTFSGDVILPAHDQYDAARRIWNAVFDRRPALIVRPRSVPDVVAAIRFARDRDLDLAVRAGGHSGAGFSTCDDGLVVDLSAMRGVVVDGERRTARANGGALLRELDAAAQARGLVCPVGVIGHTGVAGLTLGGGIGRLRRRFGLTIDNLSAVELVTADGNLVRASATEQPELFWGIRGAGSNFGLVTGFEFVLHPFDGTLTRGIRIYDAADTHEVWSMVRSFGIGAPDHVSLTCALAMAEPAADYPAAVAGRPIFIVAFNHNGDPATAETDTAPLGAGPTPAHSAMTTVRYLDLQAANDDPMGWGHRNYIKGAFANDLSAATIDSLIEHVSIAPLDASFGITLQGGAISRVDDNATAFTGRSAELEISADAGWNDPAEDDVQIAWVRRAMDLAEVDTVPGRYVNEIAETGPEETLAIYGEATVERLAALKRIWDPDNVFHLNHNVVPGG